MRTWIVALMVAGMAVASSAQTSYRYRVSLTDKAESEYSLANPEVYLSEKAIQRRIKQGLAIDSTDLPVCRSYVEAIVRQGVKLLSCSKWNNSVLVECTDTLRMEMVGALPFVSQVKKVWKSPASVKSRDVSRKEKVTNRYTEMKEYYGAASLQNTMLNVDKLHEAGFKGKGILMAVIDSGFFNADTIELLRNVSIAGTCNFVNEFDIYGEGDHGMKVLSCMAANTPYVMVGTAPEATYWLLCSEDNDSEFPVEEDFWAEAVEFADSVGVEIINSSLGYHVFDDTQMNYSYADLDGHTSLISRVASMIADKGMLLVTSAGNEGNKTWKKITVPGDASHILTVGAVDRNRLNTLFSSVGNTADGRVKPDVMALGGHSTVINVDGSIGWVNGTSFATPILCGGVACLWQALPSLTAKQLIALVQQAGDRHATPDNIFGYGIPDLWKAYQLGLQWVSAVGTEEPTKTK